MKGRTFLYSIASGLIFVACLFLSLQRIDPDWYVARDDGVITLSAARNLIDYGFIGVNPSGPIVDASSAPVQLFLYAGIYWLSHMGYFAYSMLQTYVSYFLIGAIFFLFFRQRPILSLGTAALAAFVLSFTTPAFFEWHASGMENAITGLLFVLTIFLLYTMFSQQRVVYIYALPIFLASVSRIEAIYHIAPLLLIFAAAWRYRYKNYSGTIFALLAVALWIAFMAWRVAYFGHFLPNTAYAQHISVLHRLHLLLTFDRATFAESFWLSAALVARLSLWLLLPAVLLFVLSKRTPDNIFLSVLCLSLIATSLFYPFLFGPTRIDEARATSFVFLALVILISAWLYFGKSAKASVASALFVVSAFTLAYIDRRPVMTPYVLGWSTSNFDDVRNTFVNLASDNAIARPTTANPDLGAMTWHKQLNNVDIGLLGSPVLAQLADKRAFTDYILNYAEPDFIEAHGYWIMQYCDSFLRDPGFNAKYVQYRTDYDLDRVCALPWKTIPRIFWQRRAILKNSATPERAFLDDLQDNFSVERIAAEIDRCGDNALGDQQKCSYIARTVYRFIPELRQSDKFDDVYKLFSYAPDKALLIGWREPQAYKTIIRQIAQ